MQNIYIDAATTMGAIGVCAKDTNVIRVGATVYSMDKADNNSEYERYAKEYDIHFIFDDIPVLNFFAVPQVDVFALDSDGGFIGTVGQQTDFESDAAICYISKTRETFFIADNGKSFIEIADSWKNELKPYDKIVFYKSKEEAKKNIEIVEMPDIEFPLL